METPADKPMSRLFTKRGGEPYVKGLIEIAGEKYWSSGPVETIQLDGGIKYEMGILVPYDGDGSDRVVAVY